MNNRENSWLFSGVGTVCRLGKTRDENYMLTGDQIVADRACEVRTRRSDLNVLNLQALREILSFLDSRGKRKGEHPVSRQVVLARLQKLNQLESCSAVLATGASTEQGDRS